MSNNQTDNSCRTNSWLAAIVLGILGFLLAWRWFEWGLISSIVLGAVVFFVLGYLMVNMLCGKSGSAQSQPVADAPKAAPAPKPAEPEKVAKPAPAPVAKKAPEPKQDNSAAQKPVELDGPRDGKADDLKKIKGVGPGLEKTLNENGIWHYDQIAAWSPAEVAYVDENMLRFKGRATRDDWVNQAATLAEGGETKFSKKVDKGGVY